MYSEVNLFSYLLIGAVGMLCGGLVGFGFQRPQSKAGLIVTIILGMLSPWIMISGWAFAAAIHGEMYGIHIGTALGAFCAMVVVAYVIRVARKKEVVAEA